MGRKAGRVAREGREVGAWGRIWSGAERGAGRKAGDGGARRARSEGRRRGDGGRDENEGGCWGGSDTRERYGGGGGYGWQDGGKDMGGRIVVPADGTKVYIKGPRGLNPEIYIERFWCVYINNPPRRTLQRVCKNIEFYVKKRFILSLD